MIPSRGLLITLIVTGLALATSPLHAKKGKPAGTRSLEGVIAGGSLRAKLSDLVFYDATWDIPQGSSELPYTCTGKNTGLIPLVVKIRNKGLANATWPTSLNGPWFTAWSTLSTGYDLWPTGDGYNLHVLEPGKVATWHVTVHARALVARNGKTSSFTIGFNVNPDKLITEYNDQNNMTSKTFSLGFPFCQ